MTGSTVDTCSCVICRVSLIFYTNVDMDFEVDSCPPLLRVLVFHHMRTRTLQRWHSKMHRLDNRPSCRQHLVKLWCDSENVKVHDEAL